MKMGLTGWHVASDIVDGFAKIQPIAGLWQAVVPPEYLPVFLGICTSILDCRGYSFHSAGIPSSLDGIPSSLFGIPTSLVGIPSSPFGIPTSQMVLFSSLSLCIPFCLLDNPSSQMLLCSLSW